MLDQGFILGTIRHNRYFPKPHLFTYKMYWSLVDLDKVQQEAKKYRWLSHESWNILSFRQKDFLRVDDKTNKQSIQGLIQKRTGKPFTGKVLLLSHLRFLGFNFNSVSFYFCINPDGELGYIVSEITNTPWEERHPYLHICSDSVKRVNCHVFNFDKEFHISPFVSMNMGYQWLFKIEDKKLRIHMKVSKKSNHESDGKKKILDVTFTGRHLPLTQANLNRMLFKHPFQPMKMVWRIYWQAFRLWLKKTPFYSHPKYK